MKSQEIRPHLEFMDDSLFCSQIPEDHHPTNCAMFLLILSRDVDTEILQTVSVGLY